MQTSENPLLAGLPGWNTFVFSAASDSCGPAVSLGAVSLRASVVWLSRFLGNILWIFDYLGSRPNSQKKEDCIDLYFYLSRLGFDERGEGL